METEGKFDRPELLSHSLVPLLSQKSKDSNPSTCFKLSAFRSLALDESSPEKAGVGGSIPSLATNCIRHL